MGILTRDYGILRDGIRAAFWQAIDSMPPATVWPTIATQVDVPAGTGLQTYEWLGHVPRVTEWLDQRQVSGLAKYSYSIQTRKWAATLGLEREVLDADQYGVVRLRIQQLAQEAARFKEQRCVNVLEAGLSTTCYDGEFFFDTDHPGPGGTTQSNKVALALTPDNLASVITRMRAYTDEDGNLLNITPTHLLVPSSLEFVAREILQSPVVVVKGATGSYTPYENVLQGQLQLLVTPYIADNGGGNQSNAAWCVLDCSKPLRPLILQQADQLQLDDTGDGDKAFMNDTIYFGTRERFEFGYSIWQLACWSTGAA